MYIYNPVFCLFCRYFLCHISFIFANLCFLSYSLYLNLSFISVSVSFVYICFIMGVFLMKKKKRLL